MQILPCLCRQCQPPYTTDWTATITLAWCHMGVWETSTPRSIHLSCHEPRRRFARSRRSRIKVRQLNSQVGLHIRRGWTFVFFAPFSMTPLAQLHGAVAGEVASATAVVAHRPFGRLLVVLGAVVSVAGLLDLSVALWTRPPPRPLRLPPGGPRPRAPPRPSTTSAWAAGELFFFLPRRSYWACGRLMISLRSKT